MSVVRMKNFSGFWSVLNSFSKYTIFVKTKTYIINYSITIMVLLIHPLFFSDLKVASSHAKTMIIFSITSKILKVKPSDKLF